MDELQKIRAALDDIDSELVRLFEKRMALSRQVAAYKMARGMQVLDRTREEQVLASRTAMLSDAHYAPAVRTLFEGIMALSREEQQKIMEEAEQHA